MWSSLLLGVGVVSIGFTKAYAIGSGISKLTNPDDFEGVWDIAKPLPQYISFTIDENVKLIASVATIFYGVNMFICWYYGPSFKVQFPKIPEK